MTGATTSRANSSTVRRSASCSSLSMCMGAVGGGRPSQAPLLLVEPPRQRLDDPGRAGAAEPLGQPDARGDQGPRSTPGLDAEAVQHPHQVLGGEVAGGALGVRAAADAARRGVHRASPRRERGERVRQRLAVGVVEVHREPVGGDARRAERVDQGGTWPGVATPIVSPRDSSSQPSSSSRPGRPRPPGRSAPGPPTGRRSTSTGSRAPAARRPGPGPPPARTSPATRRCRG